MFRCGLCKDPSNCKEKAVRVVIERREKEYPFRKDANIIPLKAENGRTYYEWKDDPGGQGTEIVKEELWHSACIGAAHNVFDCSEC